NPGDACWQMPFEAFRPRTICQINKVTSSERSASRGLSRDTAPVALSRRACPERGRGNLGGADPTNAARSFSKIGAHSSRSALSPRIEVKSLVIRHHGIPLSFPSGQAALEELDLR